jgi:hypothetical protein
MNQNIQFSKWKEITMLSIGNSSNSTNKKTLEKVNDFLEQSELISSDIANKTVSLAMQMMIQASGEYVSNELIEDIIPRLNETTILNNEFYTIYNIEKSFYEIVDPTLKNKLNIEPEKFNLPSLLGMIDGEIVVSENDLPHFIRWAGIAFLLFSIPTFKFTSYQDYYLIRFHVNTKNGKFLLEKRCYLSMKSIESLGNIPKYHFDKWSILPPLPTSYVKPIFVSDAEQTELMNNLAYLFNAALINFPVKYLIMLEERQYFDRNKEVGKALEDNILNYANLKTEFSDIQIGDYFKKTIRKKITETFNTWTNQNKSTCNSETEAIQLATQLGLLPIPSGIKKLIYSRVS